MGLGKKSNEVYMLAEEYIKGYEISVESITVDGITETFIIHDKIDEVEPPMFLEQCCSTYSSRITEKMKNKVIEINSEILKAIKLKNGITHVEYRIMQDSIYLIEINLRPGGGLIVESVYHSTGVNMISEYIQRILKKSKTIKKDDNMIAINGSIYAQRGVIKKINGIEDARNCIDSIKIIQNTCKIGEKVITPEASGNIEFLITGNDYEKLLSDVKKIKKKITIEVEKCCE